MFGKVYNLCFIFRSNSTADCSWAILEHLHKVNWIDSRGNGWSFHQYSIFWSAFYIIFAWAIASENIPILRSFFNFYYFPLFFKQSATFSNILGSFHFIPCEHTNFYVGFDEIFDHCLYLILKLILHPACSTKK